MIHNRWLILTRRKNSILISVLVHCLISTISSGAIYRTLSAGGAVTGAFLIPWGNYAWGIIDLLNRHCAHRLIDGRKARRGRLRCRRERDTLPPLRVLAGTFRCWPGLPVCFSWDLICSYLSKAYPSPPCSGCPPSPLHCLPKQLR